MTIRKFALRPFAPEDLIAARSMTPAVMELLSICVRARMNIVVCGGTGSGKTTLLNVLSSFVPRQERLITIEDAAELRLFQPHVISLEARPPNVEGRSEVTVRALVRNALRMRPDRIIVGEVRGGEALDMLQAMNTGHEGSMSTTHANTPRDALSRLETMALMSDVDLPVTHVREQIAGALDVIVHTARRADGGRVVSQVTSVEGLMGGSIKMLDLSLGGLVDADGILREGTRFRARLAERIGHEANLAPILGRPSAPGGTEPGAGGWAGSLRRLGGVLE